MSNFSFDQYFYEKDGFVYNKENDKLANIKRNFDKLNMFQYIYHFDLWGKESLLYDLYIDSSFRWDIRYIFLTLLITLTFPISFPLLLVVRYNHTKELFRNQF